MKTVWPSLLAAALVGALVGGVGVLVVTKAETLSPLWLGLAGLGVFSVGTAYAVWRARQTQAFLSLAAHGPFARGVLTAAAGGLLLYLGGRYFLPLLLSVLGDIDTCTTKQNCNALADGHAFKLVSGVIVFVGGALALYFSARRANAQVRATEHQARALDLNRQEMERNREQLELTQREQLSNRFTEAVKQLGDRSLTIRLGGIVGLWAVAQETKDVEDKIRVLDVLCAFVRNNSGTKVDNVIEENDSDDFKNSMEGDIYLAMTKICSVGSDFGQREGGKPYRKDISGADLRNFHLENANFAYANISNVNFRHSVLINSIFSDSVFHEADFSYSLLYESFFYFSVGVRAKFEGVELDRAVLSDGHFPHCNFERANFGVAGNRHAKMTNANFEGAIFKGALICQSFYERAITNEETVPPSNFASE